MCDPIQIETLVPFIVSRENWQIFMIWNVMLPPHFRTQSYLILHSFGSFCFRHGNLFQDAVFKLYSHVFGRRSRSISPRSRAASSPFATKHHHTASDRFRDMEPQSLAREYHQGGIICYPERLSPDWLCCHLQEWEGCWRGNCGWVEEGEYHAAGDMGHVEIMEWPVCLPISLPCLKSSF